MSKDEKLRRIVLYRLVERFSTIKEDELNESMFHNLRDSGGILNPSEKKDDENWCIFLVQASKNKEYGEFGYCAFESLYEQFLVLVDRHIERYCNNINTAKPWLKNRTYLRKYKSYDEDRLEELENNYTVYNRDEREEYNVLEFFMNETIEEFAKEAFMETKQLDITEDEYVDFVYLKVARMNNKNKLKKGIFFC